VTNFLNTIILLGALQGSIVSILLFRRRTNKQANRLLGWLLLLMSLASFNLYFLNTGWFESHQVLLILSYTIPMVIVMPMGPLIYFYIRTMIEPEFRLTSRRRLHFAAGIIDIVPEMAAIIFICGVYLGLLKPDGRPWGLFIDEYNKYADIPRWLSVTIYLLLSYGYLRRTSIATEDIARVAIRRWLKQFIGVFLVFQFIWFLYLVPYILPGYSDRLMNAVGWYPVYIPLSMLIYWLGIKGYLLTQPPTQPEKKKKPIPPEITKTAPATILILKKAMEEDKLYLNPALQLELVTTHTGVPAKMISAILNQHFQKNFNEWVNGYRVEAVKAKLREGLVSNMTIAGIAAECGFNSQASFQRIFKQSQGMTPTQYLKSLEQSV
jgi:AraC-like DNA-binding protein